MDLILKQDIQDLILNMQRESEAHLATEGGFGGDVPIYSASFSTEVGKQDYDFQAIIENTSTTIQIALFIMLLETIK